MVVSSASAAVMSESERDEHFARLVEAYEAKTPKSAALHREAKEVLPGGDTRTVAFHPPYPLTMTSGSGCTVTDADGNTMIDVLNNYTSLIHGHALPAINEAVTDQIGKGTNFAAALESQTVLANILVDRVRSVDLIRFTNSGTEATMNMVRAARAFTGRDMILKIEGGYHGTFDDFEISVHPDPENAGPDGYPVPTVDSPGLPRGTADAVLVTPFNDIPALERVFAAHGDAIAGVILEPVMGSAGMIPAEAAFLNAARELTNAHGALLLFDEVMSFRLGFGGFQGEVGVDPDLTAFAKIIGGGYPVGAFGGRREIMAMFDPASKRPMWQSGTFNGNAVTMVAGAAAMGAFPQSEVERINLLGSMLREALAQLFADRGIGVTVTGFGSFGAIHFTDRPVRNYRDAARSDQSLKRMVHLALLLEGVFAAPRLMFCTSTAMDETTVTELVSRFDRAIDRITA